MDVDGPRVPFLEIDQVGDEVRQLYEPWEERYGYVPPFRKVLAHNPEVLQAWDRFYRRVRHGGSVDQYYKELAHVVIGQSLRCPYCAASHGEILVKEYDKSLDLLAALDDGDFSWLDDTELAVAEFARQLALEPGEVTDGHVDALREVGFDSADVIELYMANCASVCSAALMKGLGVDPAHRDEELPTYYPSYGKHD